jgi:hypothetical protein
MANKIQKNFPREGIRGFSFRTNVPFFLSENQLIDFTLIAIFWKVFWKVLLMLLPHTLR